MNKFVSTSLPSFRFDAERKGAKYSLDNGEHWLNGGEFAEAVFKFALGYEPRKDGNTAFDAGSDIEELSMSVKSSKATLTTEVLGKDMDTSLRTYFERTASTSWAWVIVTDETVTAYIMNAEEFEEFTREWASYSTEGRIRYKVTSGKMVKWFEERV